MAKSIIGIDIGHKAIKIVQANGNQIKKIAVADIPDGMINDYKINSTEAMGELIQSILKKEDIQGNSAALVLSEPKVYTKNVVVPKMSEEQLAVNLPYEFRDYITDELKDYLFDYLVVEKEQEATEKVEGETDASSENNDSTIECLASAAPRDSIEDMKTMIRRAGLKLVKAAPIIYAYIGLIRSLGEDAKNKEFCFIDLGHEAIRMHMFKGERYIVSRDLDIGIAYVENRIAETLNVDIHLAHTYLVSNHENCQNCQASIDTYGTICTELQRAINFYEYSNPDSKLEEVYLCGGGAAIKRFEEEVRNTLSLKVNNGAELLNNSAIENGFMLTLGYGITQD